MNKTLPLVLKRFYLIALLASLLPACADTPATLTGLDAAVWMDSSEEYRALSLGAYHVARKNLDEALENSSWTALPAQAVDDSSRAEAPASLPPAVILDIDETVLSTLPYQAWLIENNRPFTRESWNVWASGASAQAIPGALEFVRYAMDRGVAVFYMTNRSARGRFDRNANGRIDADEQQVDLKPFTIANLLKLGFLPQKNISNEDSVLLRNETDAHGQVKKGWASSDKTARREFLAREYRIVLIMGDNLNDFVDYRKYREDGNSSDTVRKAYRSRWGRSWIMLPNPVYGYWESRLYGSDRSLSREEKTRIKLDRLKTWR